MLAAVSLPLIYWGQTARGYALMVAFVCAGFWPSSPSSIPQATSPPGRGPWLAFVVAMTLAMYCSFVAALVIPAQVLAMLDRRGAARRYGSALVAIAVLCVPLAVLAVRRGSGQLFWVQPPSRMVDTQVLQSLTSAGLQPVFHRSVTTKALMWATSRRSWPWWPTPCGGGGAASRCGGWGWCCRGACCPARSRSCTRCLSSPSSFRATC